MIKTYNADFEVLEADKQLIAKVVGIITERYGLPDIEVNLAGAASVGDENQCGFGVYVDGVIWLAVGRDPELVAELNANDTSYEMFLVTNAAHELGHAIQHLKQWKTMRAFDEELEREAEEFAGTFAVEFFETNNGV